MAYAKQAAPIVESEDELTIPVAARSALEQAEGDVVKATGILVARVAKDPTLYKPMMDPFIKTACYQAITSQCQQQRRTIWNSKQPTAEQQRDRVVALGQGTAATLMDFPLPGGMKLRNAKRDDVSAAAEFYRRQSNDMAGKAKWLQLIAQHLTGKKTVSQVMTDARLTELREEATRE